MDAVSLGGMVRASFIAVPLCVMVTFLGAFIGGMIERAAVEPSHLWAWSVAGTIACHALAYHVGQQQEKDKTIERLKYDYLRLYVQQRLQEDVRVK